MRFLLAILAAAAALWSGGFLWFLSALPEAPVGAPRAHGIVVYTGAGGARIATAMELLERQAGERLLISGVNPDIPRADIVKMWRGHSAGFDCCVDLGLEAQTTQGNAVEVRDWAGARGFTSLILVTSDFHMPRALLETQNQMPQVAITPYPVVSGLLKASGAPADVAALRRLAVEYSKYLAVRVLTLLTGA